MRAAYDKAVEDVIKVTQGQGWFDYEGTLYYPDDGVENVGDAIRRQLNSGGQLMTDQSMPPARFIPLSNKMRTEYLRPDYQAAFSQLARKFTILAHTLNQFDLGHTERDCLNEGMSLIEAVEKTELTIQVIEESS